MLGPDADLNKLAKKVSGEKAMDDGRLKRWSSWKDLENGEFVRGTYKEYITQ